MENTKQIKALRMVMNSLLNHHRIQLKLSSPTDRKILNTLQIQNHHLTSQLIEIQRSINYLSTQCRLQQEDHFEMERRLMEFKFGQDPMLMSSDSVFENCSNISSIASLSIDMRNIDMNNMNVLGKAMINN